MYDVTIVPWSTQGHCDSTAHKTNTHKMVGKNYFPNKLRFDIRNVANPHSVCIFSFLFSCMSIGGATGCCTCAHDTHTHSALLRYVYGSTLSSRSKLNDWHNNVRVRLIKYYAETKPKFWETFRRLKGNQKIEKKTITIETIHTHKQNESVKNVWQNLFQRKGTKYIRMQSNNSECTSDVQLS